MSTGVLVLNSTYEAMNIAEWERAVELIFAGKAEAIHNTNRQLRSAGGIAIPMPSVIRMLYFIKHSRKRMALTKRNVLLRDKHVCGYCGARGSDATMTVDHIVPKSQGGTNTWENLTAACSDCNARKKNRTPSQAGMPLRRAVRQPTSMPFFVLRKRGSPEEWKPYLFLSLSIEERPTT